MIYLDNYAPFTNCYHIIDLDIIVNQFGVHTCLVLPLTNVMVLVIPVH